MTTLRSSALRPWLAAVLAFVLSLAGVGRGWAAAPGPLQAVTVIAGVAVPICHADASGSAGSDTPEHHDCCDACALCAPAITLRAPDVGVPLHVVHRVAPTAAPSRSPLPVRLLTPRLSQGPPVA